MQKIVAALLLVVIGLLALLGYYKVRWSTPTDFGTPYQAVLLNNGQVYFGKLESAQSDFPVLRDVFYVASQVHPETKQVTNVLVRRGKELHGPSFMALNRQSILLIEPVKEDSQVAQLIAEQKKTNP
jgi:hypothetical protein